jgi:hypothetical protein
MKSGAPNLRAACRHMHLQHIKWAMRGQPGRSRIQRMYPVFGASWRVCWTQEHAADHTVASHVKK